MKFKIVNPEGFGKTAEQKVTSISGNGVKVLKYNGTGRPQPWERGDNICLEEQVWIDGVLSVNPWFFSIDMLLSMEGVTGSVLTTEQKWGESYSLQIYYNNSLIHEIDCGLKTTEYVARCTQLASHSIFFDLDDGPFARFESTFLTELRKEAKITPYGYGVLQPHLGLQELPSLG